MRIIILGSSSLGTAIAAALVSSAAQVFGQEVGGVLPIVSREIDACPEMDFAIEQAMRLLSREIEYPPQRHVAYVARKFSTHLQRPLRILPHDRSIRARIHAEAILKPHEVRKHRTVRRQGDVARSLLPAFSPLNRSRKFRGRSLR